MYDFLTGREFVVANAELHGLDAKAAQKALATVEMEYAQDRKISTYSKGMRQRVKMASALVHDPSLLLLDEPFNGMDPRQRMQLMDLLRRMGDEGRTVLFSSHILEEVEQLASHIEVVVAGRHAASGDFRKIRRLMTDRPHRYLVRSSDDRALAAALIADPSTSGIEVDLAEGALRIQAVDFGRFTALLPQGRPRPRHPAAHGLAVRRVPRVRLLVSRRGVGGRRCTTPQSPDSPTGPCSAAAGPSSWARCPCC